MDLLKFVGSIDYDTVLAKYDIAGSIAHTKMLAKCKIIPDADAKKIIHGLNGILNDFNAGKIRFSGEDIHMSIEAELKKRIGDAAGKMHTARSRNDQVALDERLYLKDTIKIINSKIDNLNDKIKKIAEGNIDTVMPGFTHLQNAQPVLFSHWFLSYCWMLKRDKERLAGCYKRADVMPLGSAAFAGTEFKIDRNFAAKQLGFAEISQNSVDAVSDRDFIIEFLSHCAIISMHLSRLSEDLIIWSSQQFGFIELSEKFTTGSSIMPQKKNPDYAEIVRGKTGRIYGNLIAMITVMKGLPLSYNRDMQEDKEPLFDSAETVKMILDVTSEMISEMKINADKMSAACENGFIMATDVADYLVSKGIPFRTAHGITGKVVNYCIKNKTTFGKLSLNEWRKFCPEFDESVYGVLDAKKAVEKRSSEGGTSLKSVKKQLGKI